MHYVYCSLGYEASTLYIEAESKLHADGSILYMEEVIVFLNVNNSKIYFKLEETTRMIQITTNKTEAAFFTLKTTPELHESGQFQLVHAAADFSEGSGNERQSQGELIMMWDENSQSLTQYGPFNLHADSEEFDNVSHFEIRGRSTSLPTL